MSTLLLYSIFFRESLCRQSVVDLHFAQKRVLDLANYNCPCITRGK